VLDNDRRERLRRAGERFEAAESERRAALEELKAALTEANGDSDPHEASDLTGLPPAVSAVLLDDDSEHREDDAG
jgi:hypothetical protein